MSYLYRYETKGIQSWILSSNKLRDLAGGSMLVEDLTEVAKDAAKEVGVSESDILQATSGAMTARFRTRESLERFASEWPMQLALRAPGLQLVQAWVDESEGIEGVFKALVAKRNLPPITELEVGPWVLRCAQSGLPAVLEQGRSVARSTAQDLVSLAREWSYEVGKKKGSDLVVTGNHEWSRFVSDFGKWPEGPVAVIHADGSGIGQALMNTDKDKLKDFSDTLKEATKTAVQAAVAEVSKNKDGDFFARPIVSAGDDLTYIVLAKDARRFCQAWLKAFEEETLKGKKFFGEGGLTGGAGIAIVNRNYPFSHAYELAEQLCKAAKDKVKASGRQTSVLAFKRVTNSLVDDLSKDAIGWRFSADKEEPLVDLLKAVRDLPRGSFRTWLDHFQRKDAKVQAKRLWDRAKEVADPKAWGALEAALKRCGANPTNGELEADDGIALKLGDSPTTPILDASVLKFIEAKDAEKEVAASAG